MTNKAEIVRISIENKSGLYIAQSPDIKGLLVAKTSEREVEEALPQTIANHFAVKGLKVVVRKGERRGAKYTEWIATPASQLVDA